MSELCCGFESSVAGESLRRGDGATCQWQISQGWTVRPQHWGKLSASLANAHSLARAVSWEIVPLRESSASPLPKQPAALGPASAPWLLPLTEFGGHCLRWILKNSVCLRLVSSVWDEISHLPPMGSLLREAVGELLGQYFHALEVIWKLLVCTNTLHSKHSYTAANEIFKNV